MGYKPQDLKQISKNNNLELESIRFLVKVLYKWPKHRTITIEIQLV
jgi:hypothetical protein